MSQEKVDRYKQDKANREQLIKKQKRVRLLERLGVGVVCLAIVGWIAFSGYRSLTREEAAEQVTTEMDVTAINDYLSSLSVAGEE
jgi:hypothetical protein